MWEFQGLQMWSSGFDIFLYIRSTLFPSQANRGLKDLALCF